MRILALIVLAVLLGDTQPAAAEERTIETITIKSMWGGHLEYADTKLRYERGGDRLYLDRHPVDPRKVRSLIEALQSRPVEREDAFKSRISQMWLDRHARFAAEEQPFWRDPHEKAKFEALFRDRDFMAQVFAELLNIVVMDDISRVELSIRFSDGDVWSAGSDSNHLFMLPWTVHRGDKAVETFDLNIAKAIGLLLPHKANNRWRLLGEDAPDELGRQIRRHLDRTGAR